MGNFGEPNAKLTCMFYNVIFCGNIERSEATKNHIVKHVRVKLFVMFVYVAHVLSI